MTITVEMTPQAEQEIQSVAARQGKTVAQVAQEAMIAELKNHHTPQTLDELAPRRLPPPGKTVWDMVVGQWPGDETDEELQAALKAMG